MQRDDRMKEDDEWERCSRNLIREKVLFDDKTDTAINWRCFQSDCVCHNSAELQLN